MTFTEIEKIFRAHEESKPDEHLTAYITFSSFGEACTTQYTKLSRTYGISSDNKAFKSGMGGYSIFGYCLDGTDQGIRLDQYMRNPDDKARWKVEDCCLVMYMLNETIDREINTPEFFMCFTAAKEAMITRLAEATRQDAGTMLKWHADGKPLNEDGEYQVMQDTAWANAKCGHCDWAIHEILLYNATDITTSEGNHNG